VSALLHWAVTACERSLLAFVVGWKPFENLQRWKSRVRRQAGKQKVFTGPAESVKERVLTAFCIETRKVGECAL
jgi:hypothetical protein